MVFKVCGPPESQDVLITGANVRNLMQVHGLQYVNPYLNTGKPDMARLHKTMRKTNTMNPNSIRNTAQGNGNNSANYRSSALMQKSAEFEKAGFKNAKPPSRREEFEILMSKQLDFQDARKDETKALIRDKTMEMTWALDAGSGGGGGGYTANGDTKGSRYKSAKSATMGVGGGGGGAGSRGQTAKNSHVRFEDAAKAIVRANTRTLRAERASQHADGLE